MQQILRAIKHGKTLKVLAAPGMDGEIQILKLEQIKKERKV